MPYEAKLAEYGILGILVLLCLMALTFLWRRLDETHRATAAENKTLHEQLSALHEQRTREMTALHEQRVKEHAELFMRLQGLQENFIKTMYQTIASLNKLEESIRLFKDEIDQVTGTIRAKALTAS